MVRDIRLIRYTIKNGIGTQVHVRVYTLNVVRVYLLHMIVLLILVILFCSTSFMYITTIH